MDRDIDNKIPLNAITVDVEEYFHATNLESVAPPSRWHSLPQRVEISTNRVLELFATCNVRGTFFVLGCSARRFPQLVRRIADSGHEIASHGYAHRLAYKQTKKAFARDIRKSKFLLEDVSGRRVLGYRAPNFSIRDENLWAYDELIAAGYLYDSSLYPVPHPRYGNPHRELSPHVVCREAGKLVVFPLAVKAINAFGRSVRLGVAGGAYWRILPRVYCAWGLRAIQKEMASDSSSRWFTCYFHPWELDAGQPIFQELPFLTKLRHYSGVRTYHEVIAYFLRNFRFGPLEEAATQSFGEKFSLR